MIQKRITSLDFTLQEMLNEMRANYSKMTVHDYLQRRLDLLLNPPEDKNAKMLTSIIVHIITFFLRFVTEGIAILLHLNVFKAIKNAVDKHTEDNDYILGLLKIVLEVLRYCECCTPHISEDDVITSFHETNLPTYFLRLYKRFGSTSDVQFVFLPLIITCHHPITKYWLQNNYKNFNHHYKTFLKYWNSDMNFYPDETHSQMIYKSTADFKILMNQLQKGNSILHEECPLKNRRKGKMIEKKEVKSPSNYFKKIGPESVKIDDNIRDSMKRENIIVAVISNKKRDDSQLSFEENQDNLSGGVYWSSVKLDLIRKNHQDSDEGMEEDSADITVYPNWKEHFKDGIELFGLTVDRNEEETECRTAQEPENKTTQYQAGKMENNIFHLDNLFIQILNIYEHVWQRNYLQTTNMTDDIDEYIKLMYAMPNLEIFHWLNFTKKWKDLCEQIRNNWEEDTEKTILELKKYLESTIAALHMKYKHVPNMPSLNNNSQQNEKSTDIQKETNKNTVDVPITDVSMCPENKSKLFIYSTSEEVNQIARNLTESKVITKAAEGDKSLISTTQTFWANLDRNKNEPLNESVSKHQDYVVSDSNNTSDWKASVAEDCRERCLLQSDVRMEPDPPPGFLSKNKTTESFRKPSKNWRKIKFCLGKHISFIKGLNILRQETIRQRKFVMDIIIPSQHLKSQFIIGRGGSFGDVYLGLDPSSGKPLAVKSMLASETLGLRMRCWLLHGLMRTLMEVDPAASCLVPYTHCFQSGVHLYLITPLCQWNLSEFLGQMKNTEQFTKEAAVSLIQQALKALHFLHSQRPPIIHGNLKPNNILIDALGNLRLADFGIYKVLFQDICTSMESAIWWSRETYWHYHKNFEVMITCKSDIQVCGMLCHYILSGGLHPFGQTTEEVVNGILSNKAILRVDVPEALDLISWMISSRPDRRPNTDQLVVHIINWDQNKKWDFLLVCAGAPTLQSQGLPTLQFHKALDRYAKQQNVSINWVPLIENKVGGPIDDCYIDTLSGLLYFLRNNLPFSAQKFLSILPTLPLTLFRLLEGTRWIFHPDIAQFTSVSPYHSLTADQDNLHPNGEI